MFLLVLSLSNVLCITDIYPSRTESQSTKETNGNVKTSNRDLNITLNNGAKYVLKDAVVESSDNSSGTPHLTLQDGSEIDVNSTNLGIKFKDNEDVKIHNVENVEKNDNNIVLKLQNGEEVVIKDAKNYQDEGNGVYNIGTRKNTSIKNYNDKNEKEDSKKKDKKDKKNKKNKSTVKNGAFSFVNCSIISLLVLGNTLYTL